MIAVRPSQRTRTPGSRLHVLGVSGSLRDGYYNTRLIEAAHDLAPPGMTIRPFSLRGIPLYDGEVEAAGDPPAVTAWKRAIADADAILIATPEYNHGTSGVLKNAIDWASRPARQSVLDRKPVAIVGASTGIGGTVQAQSDVRRALTFPGAQSMPEPELYVSRARTKFDEGGELTDAATLAGLRSLLQALGHWTSDVRALAVAA